MVRFPPGPLPRLVGWTEFFFGGLIVIRLGVFILWPLPGQQSAARKNEQDSLGVDNNRHRSWKIADP
ncbi:MAG TPA: hypothetical protein QF695_00535 [Arenicellales bacterium]|jgi:hypothetical protein|nr:hypothetical protein [Arenicellales bacterium]|tara:strand:+ start:318 stop:518 length:201 start_codon:yes stop_codon:yes gene_type:complete